MFLVLESEGVTNGVCLYYGRTELKQSDHRPVFAVIDIDINTIDSEQRVQQVYYQVLEYLGPPDGTICLKCTDIEYESEFVNSIVSELSNIGRVIMVRFDGDTMWATFHDPQCCLAAVNRSSIKVNGYDLQISLRSPNWVQEAKKEIALCTNNTVSMKLNNVHLMSEPPSTPRSSPASPHRPPPLRPPKPTADSKSDYNESLLASDREASIDRPEPNFTPPSLPPPTFKAPTMQQPSATAINNPPPIPARSTKPPPLPARAAPLPPK